MSRTLGANILSSWDQTSYAGFSQQFETLQSLPDKVFYAEGCWRYCYSFEHFPHGGVVKHDKHEDSSRLGGGRTIVR